MGRKNGQNQWKEEIDTVFDTKDIDVIIDRSGYWFQKIKNGTDNESEKIKYWLERAYEHEQTNENPFFPVLLMYAICLNEDVSTNKLESDYMKYAVQYVNETERGVEGWLAAEKNNLSDEQRNAADIFMKTSAEIKAAKKEKSFGKKHLAAGFAAGLLAGLLIGSLGTAAVQKMWDDKSGAAIKQEQTGSLPNTRGDETDPQNAGEAEKKSPSAEKSSSDENKQEGSTPAESSSPDSTPAESSDTGITNRPLGENGDENTGTDDQKNTADIIAGAKVQIWTSNPQKAVNLRSSAEAKNSSNIIAKVDASAGLVMEAVGKTEKDSDGRTWRAVRFLNNLPDDLSETEQKGIQILTDEGIKEGDICYVAEQYLRLAEE